MWEEMRVRQVADVFGISEIVMEQLRVPQVAEPRALRGGAPEAPMPGQRGKMLS